MSAAALASATDTGAIGSQPQTDRFGEYVARVVAEAPALSHEQRDRLALLLHDRRVAE